MSCCNHVSPAGFERTEEQGLQIVTLTRSTCQEYFITSSPIDAETPRDLFRKTAVAVSDLGARIVSLEIFGISGSEAPALAEAFGEITWPVLWLEEGCEHPRPLFAMQVWAVAGPCVDPIMIGDRIVGSMFTSEGVQYCRLGGLLPADITASRADQTSAVFTAMQDGLRAAGMDFSHVIRTWFYNYEMLQWYDEFNKVRTAFFHEHKVFDGLVPASTGIGGRNAAGAALTAGLIAVRTPGSDPKAIASPLQCPALDYGSSFSRAVEVETPGYRRLMISGTASIAPEGHSVHIGDIDKQIQLTCAVAEAILQSRGMSWQDLSRAIAYFKYGKDAQAFTRFCAAQHLPSMPFLYTANDICRDDLLFEIELDAIVEAPSA